MTIASTVTESNYTGNGLTTEFPITFEYTEVSQIKLYLDDVEETNFTFDNVLAPTEVIPDNLVASGVAISIRRETEVIQSVDLLANQNYSDSAENIEKGLDNIVQMIQEMDTSGTSTSTTSSTSTVVSFPDWEVATDYSKGTVVFDTDSRRYYRVTVDNYSSDPVDINADIQVGNLEVFPSNNQGEKGDKGDKGESGNDGQDGAVGATGANGADGVFSEIATTLEAQEGTNNDKGMTPLRVKESFDENYIAKQEAIDLRSAQVDQALTELRNEVELLKSSISTAIGRYSGAQFIEESTTAPIALTGLNGGVGLTFNRVGTEFVNVQMYIRRGSEEFASFEAILHYVNGTWYISRKETFVLDETLELDGITLSVVTDTNGVGQVFYEANSLVGTYVKEDNYIMWLGQEIPKTIIS